MSHRRLARQRRVREGSADAFALRLLQGASLAYVAILPFDSAVLLAGRSITFYLVPLLLLLYLPCAARLHATVVWSGVGRAGAGLMAVVTVAAAISLLWTLNLERGQTLLLTLVGLVVAAWVLANTFATLGWAPMWTLTGSLFLVALGSFSQAFAVSDAALRDPLSITSGPSRIASFGLQENLQAFYLAVGVAGAIALMGHTRRTLIRCGLVVVAAVDVAAVLRTGSRTGAIALASIVVALVFVLLVGKPTPTMRAGVALLLVIGAAAVYLFITLQPSFVPERIWQADDALANGDFARGNFWAAAWSDRASWMLVGQGWGSSLDYLYLTFGFPYVLHNTYLAVLVEGGLMLAVPFFAMLACVAITGLRGRYRVFLGLSMLPAFLFTLSTSLQYNKLLWLLIAVALTPALRLPARAPALGPRSPSTGSASRRSLRRPSAVKC